MRESNYSPYAKLVKRITFNDEATLRRGGGVPTDVDFSDGKGTFGTATSVIDYGNSSEFNLCSNFSLRTRFNFVSTGSNQALIAKGGGSTTQYILSITSSDKIRFFGYEGGVSKGNTIGATIAEGEHEVIATFNGTHWICYVDSVEVFDTVGSASLANTTQSLQIGARGGTVEWNDTIDLVEIYSGVLTPSEVANLYNGTWNKEPVYSGSLKSDVITNGGFDTDTDWNKTGSWTIANGYATGTANSSSHYLGQKFGAVVGKKYLLKYTILENTLVGTSFIYLSSTGVFTSAPLDSTVGTHTVELVATNSTPIYDMRFFLTSGSTSGIIQIDDVSIREFNPKNLIDFDSSSGSLKDRCVGNTVGDDLLSGWDFTSGWTGNGSGGAIVDSNTFSVTGTYGVYKYPGLTAGKRYRLHIKGTRVASSFLAISNVFYNDVWLRIYDTEFDEVIEFTPATHNSFMLYNVGSVAGDVYIEKMNLYEIRPDLDITSVTTVKTGSNYSAKFDGADSKIDLGVENLGTKSLTIMGWIKPYGWGEAGAGRILTNEKTRLAVYDTNERMLFASDFSTLVCSANNSITLNKWNFVAVTREVDGTVNFYVGDKSTAPALSGSADQDSGSPVAGTTNVIIGNNNGQTRTFDGLIPKIKVVENVLTLAEITREWSSSRGEI